MRTTVAPKLVTLRGGGSVSLPALQTLWSLEDRGFHVRVDADSDALVIRPRARITPDDDQAIRAHRVDLVTLVDYCTEVI